MRIVYVDEALVVIEKPPGVLAVPGRGPDKQECAAREVQRFFTNASVVHRLDRDTSGLMVMSRGSEMQRRLAGEFEARRVEKRYVAVVYGPLADGCGQIELPLRKDFDRPPRHCVDVIRGRATVTNWRVIRRLTDRSRVELAPLTGRSHQLRVHLAHIGHPILGDPLYAHDAALSMADRLMLHATRLRFTHPKTGEPMTWDSECPF